VLLLTFDCERCCYEPVVHMFFWAPVSFFSAYT
jgi:hypothetical protein